MQLTLLSGYPDNVGRRHIWCGFGSGPGPTTGFPTGYATGGEPLNSPRFQFYFDAVFPAVSASGTYIVYGVASGVGARQEWRLKWVDAATGAEVAANTNLDGEQVQLAGFGGQF
jgi:hypothetical protein